MEDWSSSKLVVFIKCLDMPMEGYEIGILNLLRKLKARKEMKGREFGKRRNKVSSKFTYQKKKKRVSSKFERELKRLECMVNFLGAIGSGKEVDNGGWDVVPVCK